MRRVRFVPGLFVLLVAAAVACTDGRPERPPAPPPQALDDSIEAGYERLQRVYARADTVPASVRQMSRAMGQMHGQMRRHRQAMESEPRGGRNGRGMHGGPGMEGRDGMHRGRHHGRSTRARRDSLGLWEWHQQMMSMHAQMAQMHGQRAQERMAERHRQMERRHRQMMRMLPAEGETELEEGSESLSAEEPLAVSGEDLYVQQCATCHGREGTGLGTFPPLAGSRWVTGDGDTAIRILLHGLQGRIAVDGRTYNNVMPAFGRRLSDQEIAALLSFVRSSWGNEDERIEAEDVREIRRVHPNRTQPWTASELETISE